MKKKWKKALHTMCEGCGTCCTEPTVPVTDSDVKRLMKISGKTADQIVRFYDSTEIDYESDAESWVQLSYGKRAMGLKKKKNRCQFLDDSKRCTVYPSRPMTCRSFPLQIEVDEDGDLEDLSVNKITRKSYPKGPKRKLKDVIKIAQKEDREDEKYFKKIAKWNKKHGDGGKMDFLKFIGLAS